jgi:hypothetical protein
MIAANAHSILDARKKGLRPAEMILVSLIGQINELNHTVYARPNKDYDWQWVRGLEICVYTQPDVDWQSTLLAIAACGHSFLAVWDVVNREGANVYRLPHPDDIDKPKSQWRWNLDFLPWLPSQNKEFAQNKESAWS